MHAHQCTPTALHGASSRIGLCWSFIFSIILLTNLKHNPGRAQTRVPVAMRQSPGHLLRFIAVNAQNRHGKGSSIFWANSTTGVRRRKVSRVSTAISYFSPDGCSPVEKFSLGNHRQLPHDYGIHASPTLRKTLSRDAAIGRLNVRS